MVRNHKKAAQQQFEGFVCEKSKFLFSEMVNAKTLSVLLSLRVADQWHSKCHLAAWKTIFNILQRIVFLFHVWCFEKKNYCIQSK